MVKIPTDPEYWRRMAESEEGYEIGAGVPDKPKWNAPQWILEVRAAFAWVWRIGLIKRTTALRWEMDRFIGEWT